MTLDEIDREHIGDLKYLGGLIAFLREDKGLSQRQLALYAGISNTELHRIETAQRQKPSPKILEKLSEILDVDYETLLQAAGYLDLQDGNSNSHLNYELLNEEEKNYIIDYICNKWNRENKNKEKKYTRTDIVNALFSNENKQIDDVLNEAMIGMSDEDYEKLTETQKKQIRDFAIFVKNQSEGDKK